MSGRSTLLLASLFITIAALANLARVFWNISVRIGSLTLPAWTGAFLYIALGLLAAWSFKAVCDYTFSHPPIDPSNP